MFFKKIQHYFTFGLEVDVLFYHFSDPDSARPTLLGMAMESYSDVDIKLVRCLVSIVLGISDLHQRQTLEELRQCSNKIVKMQKYLKGIEDDDEDENVVDEEDKD